uniref:Podocalyxin n=1 Tax=Pygocentrus nattereri TaxID=42514 RepID=A0A3B4DH61_PYGNA
MWTKTRMLWTIFVLGFLLQYTNAESIVPTNSSAPSTTRSSSSVSMTTTVQPSTSAPLNTSTLTSPPSSAASTTLKSIPSSASTTTAVEATTPTSRAQPTSKILHSVSQGSTPSSTPQATITITVNSGASPQSTTSVKATTSNSTTAQGSTQTKAPNTPSSSTGNHPTTPNIRITSVSTSSDLPGPIAQKDSFTQSTTAKISTIIPSILSTLNSKHTRPSVTDSPIDKSIQITATTNQNTEAVTKQVTHQNSIPTTALNRSPSTGTIKPFNDVFVRTCRKLLKNYNAASGCTLEVNKRGDDDFAITSASLTVDPNEVNSIYSKEKMSEHQPTPVPSTLIAILSSCGALLLFLVCFALYCVCHHRSYRKNQQHLTEELQTVENGYHDNPTLEVMEVQPEMQEKKLTLNGEFNDSWIVPIDNLAKEDIPDEEDTHL